MASPIKLYGSEHCKPCHDVLELVKAGKFISDIAEENLQVDFVDVTTEEGFAQVATEGLTHVPTAKYNGKVCSIAIEKDDAGDSKVLFGCLEP